MILFILLASFAATFVLWLAGAIAFYFVLIPVAAFLLWILFWLLFVAFITAIYGDL